MTGAIFLGTLVAAGLVACGCLIWPAPRDWWRAFWARWRG